LQLLPYAVRADGSLVDGMLFAGGQKWSAMPFGDFVSYNLTSDKETGLGGWSDDQIKAVLTQGIRPDGSRMLPYPDAMAFIREPDSIRSQRDRGVSPYDSAISNRIPAPRRPQHRFVPVGQVSAADLKKDMPLVTYPGNAGSAGGV
jgi:hypothetical protein